MSAGYGTKYERPIGASRKAFGGAGVNAPIDVLKGEGDMVGTFDDFDGVMITEAGGGTANWNTSGWVTTDQDTPVGDEISMNDAALVAVWAPSCIRIFPGTADDHGINMQLDAVNASLPASGGHTFPHVWIPETAAGIAVMDNTTWYFACRVGIRADITTTGSGVFEGKAFIGWATAGGDGDDIMTTTTGAMAAAQAGEQRLGFHINGDAGVPAQGINGISQRVGTTAYVEGTNFTQLVAANGFDGIIANGAGTVGDTMWFDLALRVNVANADAAAVAGVPGAQSTCQFFHRALNRVNPTNPGKNPEHDDSGQGYPPWTVHGTVLSDVFPEHTVSLVPTIEVINGPTGGRDCVFYVDWWSMGHSRWSRVDNLET